MLYVNKLVPRSAARISNPHTRRAYAHPVGRFLA